MPKTGYQENLLCPNQLEAEMERVIRDGGYAKSTRHEMYSKEDLMNMKNYGGEEVIRWD